MRGKACRFERYALRAVLELLAVSLATACWASVPLAQTLIRFSLNGRFDGPAAPYLVAAEKGYFKNEGIDVAFDPAANAIEPISRLAGAGYDLAVGDINELMKFNDRTSGAPIKAVFIVYNRPPYAVIGRRSRGIGQPKDLEDKKLGAPAADVAFAQWPLFAQLTDIDADSVTIVNISEPVREPMLAAGEVDAVTGSAISVPVDLEERGVPADDIDVMLMAYYGVDLYGDAILANPKFASGNPAVVRAFLRALLRGLKDTVADPGRAADAVLGRGNRASRKDLALRQLRIAIKENILTPEVRAQGYGGIDAARFEQGIEQTARFYKFRTKPRPDDVFDPGFLPPASERMPR